VKDESSIRPTSPPAVDSRPEVGSSDEQKQSGTHPAEVVESAGGKLGESLETEDVLRVRGGRNESPTPEDGEEDDDEDASDEEWEAVDLGFLEPIKNKLDPIGMTGKVAGKPVGGIVWLKGTDILAYSRSTDMAASVSCFIGRCCSLWRLQP
jgi:hypothetical protein